MTRRISPLLLIPLAAAFALSADVPARKDFATSAALEKGFTVVKKQSTSLGEKRSLRSKSDRATLTLSREMTEPVARKFVDDKLFLVESLFKEQPSPYPGALSYKIGCPKEFQPERSEAKRVDGWTSAMKVRANDRFVSGGCTEDANSFARYLVFVYCAKAGRLLELDYYTPIHAPTLTIDELVTGCVCDNG